MYNFYSDIQQIISSNDSPEEKATQLFNILEYIKEICGKQIFLEVGTNRFDTDSQDSRHQEIVDHLRKALISSDDANILHFKKKLVNFFHGEELDSEELINLFSYSMLKEQDEACRKTDEREIYKNWYLLNHINGENPKWDILLGDNYYNMDSTINSVFTDITISEDSIYSGSLDNEYVINHSLLESEVKAISLQMISRIANISLIQATKEYYVGTIGDSHLIPGIESQRMYNNVIIEALANAKITGNPSFISVCENNHWSTVSIFPNPNNTDEIALIYLDSNLGKSSEKVAKDIQKIVNNNIELGLRVNPDKVFEFSKKQQVSECCGLAAASNNASLVLFHKNMNFIYDSKEVDFQSILEIFYKEDINYLFNPIKLLDMESFEEIDRMNQYVKNFGQGEFEYLKNLCDKIIDVSAVHNDTSILHEFNSKLLEYYEYLELRIREQQINKDKLYAEETLSPEEKEYLQIEKQIEDDKSYAEEILRDEIPVLSQEIGEAIGIKLFTSDMSESRVEDTKKIIIHLLNF